MAIAAKCRDVTLNPLQRGNLIQQRKIIDHLARRILGVERRMREKAEMAKAVIECHHHHTLRCQRFAAIGIKAAGTDAEAAAVQPYHHR